VRFSAGCGASGYLTQWYNGAPRKSGATPVIVGAGAAITDINAVMQR
jgi:hypothetical protein